MRVCAPLVITASATSVADAGSLRVMWLCCCKGRSLCGGSPGPHADLRTGWIVRSADEENLHGTAPKPPESRRDEPQAQVQHVRREQPRDPLPLCPTLGRSAAAATAAAAIRPARIS